MLVSRDKTYTKTAPSGSYPDTGNTELTDGTTGAYTGGGATDFVGWQNTSPTVTIDLGMVYPLEFVRFFYSVYTTAAVLCPTALAVSGSLNGSDFTTIDSFEDGTDWLTSDGNRWSNNLKTAVNYRYVRFVFTKNGTNNWMFLSELEVHAKDGGTFLLNFV